ncbi:SanA protein [Symbiobacterium terraclitae]|uniref:SanA protein n=1 Tax=Symbiobacterium terraclitae TaxID=557451 RepID=A0ABS4JTW8_9FIRM|nr:SanA protein [Symbiobacterium terraclitae]
MWRWRRWGVRLVIVAVAGAVLLLAINALVYYQGRALIVAPGEARTAQAVLVLGAGVSPDGRVSPMLRDRLETALALYRAGKVEKFLLSGDHGRKDYDEVNAMRRYLEAQGVPPHHLFMDHAGFDTYDSLYRAAAIFQADDVIVVTQEFHLPRALWIATRLGLDAQGVAADRHRYRDERLYAVREFAARVKAFGEVAIRRRPAFLGDPIPITGDGRATHDQP